jgi:hypothetical protein
MFKLLIHIQQYTSPAQYNCGRFKKVCQVFQWTFFAAKYLPGIYIELKTPKRAQLYYPL